MNQDKEIRELREEVSRLKILLEEKNEVIIQLKAALLPPEWQPPVELNLTSTEARVFVALYKADGEIATKERIYYSMYHDKLDQPEIKIVDVIVCKMRRKVKDFGVEIKTHFGRGYSLDKTSIEIVKDWGIDQNETQ